MQQQIDELNFEIKSKEHCVISKKALTYAYNHLEEILKDGKKEDIIDFVKLLIHEVIVKIDKKTKRGQIIIKPHILPAEITKVFIGNDKDDDVDNKPAAGKKNKRCEPTVNLKTISSHLCSEWLPACYKNANSLLLSIDIVIFEENHCFYMVSLEDYEKKMLLNQPVISEKYDPVSAALAIKNEIEQKRLTLAEYARLVGCSRANITKRLRHLKTI